MTYWLNKINTITEEFIQQFGHLPNDVIMDAPEGQWSIALHVEHLMQVNRSYFPVFDQIIEGKYSPPKWALLKPWVSFCGDMVYKAVKPETRKKTSTLPLWEPELIHDGSSLWEAFQSHQEHLIHYFNQLSPLVPKGLVIASPANRMIIYTLEKALMIIPAHELRHLNHAMTVKKTLL